MEDLVVSFCHFQFVFTTTFNPASFKSPRWLRIACRSLREQKAEEAIRSLSARSVETTSYHLVGIASPSHKASLPRSRRSDEADSCLSQASGLTHSMILWLSLTVSRLLGNFTERHRHELAP